MGTDLATAAFNPGAGFADPVFQSQAAFRAILAALSEPGTIHALDIAIEAPGVFHPATAIALMTLADYETPLWLAESVRAGGSWARFHCSTPLTDTPFEAAFAVVAGHAAEPLLAAFNPGNDLFPDRAATLLIECKALEGGDFEGGDAVTLSGPGIETSLRIAPQGLRAGFWDEVIANNAAYPLGVDILLVSGNKIMGLPRSTQVEMIEERR